MASTVPTPELPPQYLEESIGHRLVNTAIAFIVLQTLFTVFREIARQQKRASFRLREIPRQEQKTYYLWADALVPLALLFNITLCVLCIVVVKHAGAGRHTQAVIITNPELVPRFFKILYIAAPVIYCMAAALPKLAIVDIYLHIFVEPWARWATYATGLVTLLNTVVNIPIVIWQCRPTAYLWNPSIPNGHCNNIQQHFLYASLPNIVTDVVMLVLPIPMILKLHASRKVKAGVAVTFLTGSLGLITSILRFVGFTHSYADTFWSSIDITIWTIIEPGIYLIAACLLTLRPLITYIVYQSPLSSLLSKARLTSKANNENPSQHDPVQRLPSGDARSDIDGLVPPGLGGHDTYVLHGPKDDPTKWSSMEGIHIERQISTRSSTVSLE